MLLAATLQPIFPLVPFLSPLAHWSTVRLVSSIVLQRSSPPSHYSQDRPRLAAMITSILFSADGGVTTSVQGHCCDFLAICPPNSGSLLSALHPDHPHLWTPRVAH